MGSSISTADIPDLTDKVVIITGGTAGLGLASAVEIARKGAHVIITARNSKRGEEALNEIRRQLGTSASSANIEYGIADQEDLKTVGEFAAWFLAKNIPLHVLMLNAGVACLPYKLINGVESQMFINHVSHFYLTHLLIAKLKKSSPSRVVVVSSDAHKFVSRLELDGPPPEKYQMWNAYCYSKLANIHFTKALQRRVIHDNIYVNALHPGEVLTSIFDKWNLSGFTKKLIKCFIWLFGQSLSKGALTQLYLATSPAVEAQGFRGQYFYPVARLRSKLPSYADDERISEDLWDWSEEKVAEVLRSPAVVTAAIGAMSKKQA